LGEWLYKKFEENGVYHNDFYGDHDYESTKKAAIDISNELKSKFKIQRR